MPRPNPSRTIQSELNLARRIAFERSQRDWSLEGLAKRMTDVGCSIQGSAIYKIEKADPPRRISVDELVAFSKVFSVPVEQLLLPVEVAIEAPVREAVNRFIHADSAVWAATNDLLLAVLDINIAAQQSGLGGDAAWQIIESMTAGAVSADVSGETGQVVELVHEAIHDGVRQMLGQKLGEP